MRATQNAPRGPSRVLERRHGLAAIFERGGGAPVERPPVNPIQLEREFMTFAKNASRHGHRFAQQRLDFFEALQLNKTPRVVVGCYKGIFMFYAIDFQTPGVYV